MAAPRNLWVSPQFVLLLLSLLAATSFPAAMAADLIDHPQNLPRPVTPDAVVGDFNGDGHQDLAVLNIAAPVPGTCVCEGNATVRVLFGSGTTVFTPGPEVPALCEPGAMVVGDFTGDGILDIVTMDGGYGDCLYASTLSLFRGDGIGGLQWLFATTPLWPLVDIAAGDVDGDGVSDVVGVTVFGSLMRFRYNPTGPQFLWTFASPVERPPVSRVALGDIDGDGKLDVIASAAFFGAFDVYRGNGAGDFFLQEICVFDTGERTQRGMILADLDGAGPPEIVVVGSAPEGLAPGFIDRFQRDASGNFCGNRHTLTLTGETFTSVVAADFDGDGRIDLATSGSVPGVPGQETTGVVRLFPNDGNGGIGPSTAYPIWESDHRLAVGDFNADARPDLVAVGRVNERTLAGHAHVFFNGVPSPPHVQVTMATQPDRVTWADSGADSYDVIYGDLRQLNATSGRFDSATLGCVANDLTGLQVGAGASSPPVGNGWFYLVRGNSAAGGTFDSGDRAQIGHRDQEIAAAPLACP